MTGRSLIDAVWETAGSNAESGPSPVRILPDGCVDLIWHEGGLLVAGPDLVARMATVSAGSASCGVRFLPGSARAMFGVPGEALAGGSIPAAQVLGQVEAERLSAALASALPAARPELLRRWAGRRIALGAARDPAIARASDLLTAEPTMRVSELADRVGYSERQLRRRVQAEVGYGPKLLARILRLQRTRRLVRADRSLTLAEAALLGGFVDQAHLGHECSALAGTTASDLLAGPVA